MVPQYCSHGYAGMPAVPATIFISGETLGYWTPRTTFTDYVF